MKTILLILFFFIASSATFAQEQTEHTPLNLVVSTNLITAGLNIFSEGPEIEWFGASVSLEKQIAHHQSIELTGDRLWSFFHIRLEHIEPPVPHIPSGMWHNFITSKYKFYVSKEKPMAGFYCGAYANYERDRYMDDYYPPEESIAGGGLIGAQWLFVHNHLALDLQLGIGARKSIHTTEKYAYTNPDYLPGLNLGWKF